MIRRTVLLGGVAALAACSQNPGRVDRYPVPAMADPSEWIDAIVIQKSRRRMVTFRRGEQLQIYPVVLGFAPLGHKQFEGDGRTPEGTYFIDRKNDRSSFHLSLGISYPNAQDVARARAVGKNPGGAIMIHGQPNRNPVNDVLDGDWTAGCVAVSNAQIRHLWSITPLGTAVFVKP